MSDRPPIHYIDEPAVPRPAIAYIGEAPPAEEPVANTPAAKRGKKASDSSDKPDPSDEPES
jgi:hypothetical protein